MLLCSQSKTWKFFDASILERLRNVWGPIPECLGAGLYAISDQSERASFKPLRER
jgi:hypothetical protein